MSIDVQAAVRYVDGLRTGPGSYRMAAAVDGTLFTDLFAFFVFHLAGPGAEPADALRARLLEAQDAATGMWKPVEGRTGTDRLHTPEYVTCQLTTFVLAALAAMGAAPRRRVGALDAYPTETAVREALEALPWSVNPWHSGNRAMQIGSLLAWDLNHGRGEVAAPLLQAWFEWHEQAARPDSGFWGEGHRADWHVGMGGAAHQYVVYDYCGRRPPHLEKAVERTLRLQYADGRFWPVVGGGSCYELDAVQILRVGHRHLPAWRPRIESAARRVIDVLRTSANPDGGLCWARRRWFDVGDLARNITVTGDPRSMFWSLRAQANAHLLRHREARDTAWALARHDVGESSVFDTWFRLLTAAQVHAITGDPRVAGPPWRSLPAPNWGYF
jgi:hypothetical protein